MQEIYFQGKGRIIFSENKNNNKYNFTGNIYESVAIIGKRANQISVEIKQDLSKKLAEFASYNDSLEEVFENREQIEISRYYEKLPKPTLLATEEFLDNQVYFRDPSKDKADE